MQKNSYREDVEQNCWLQEAIEKNNTKAMLFLADKEYRNNNREKMIAWLEKAANLNDVTAMEILFEENIEENKNEQNQIFWLEKITSLKQDSYIVKRATYKALENLVKIYSGAYLGEYPVDYDKAFSYAQRLLEYPYFISESRVYQLMGNIYLRKQDWPLVKYYYEKADSLEGYVVLISMYLNGEGVDKNPYMVEKYLNKLKNLCADYYLIPSIEFLLGFSFGENNNYEKAIQYLEPIYNRSDVDTLCKKYEIENEYFDYLMGVTYLSNWINKKDESDFIKGEAILRTLVNKNEDVCDLLGTAYLEKEDFISARECFEIGALNGWKESQYILGLMYEGGWEYNFDDVPDYKMAVAWYEKAAVQGHSEAISRLSYLYKNGIGVEQNYEKAYGYEKMQYQLDNK